MKKALFITAALLAFGSLPAQAQIRLDMNKVTCADFLRYSKPDQDFVRFWMSGYYSAAANNSVLDYDRLQKNTATLGQYCQKNKKTSLPTAIKALLDKA
jgi:hypothetical protein